MSLESPLGTVACALLLILYFTRDYLMTDHKGEIEIWSLFTRRFEAFQCGLG